MHHAWNINDAVQLHQTPVTEPCFLPTTITSPALSRCELLPTPERSDAKRVAEGGMDGDGGWLQQSAADNYITHRTSTPTTNSGPCGLGKKRLMASLSFPTPTKIAYPNLFCPTRPNRLKQIAAQNITDRILLCTTRVVLHRETSRLPVAHTITRDMRACIVGIAESEQLLD